MVFNNRNLSHKTPKDGALEPKKEYFSSEVTPLWQKFG